MLRFMLVTLLMSAFNEWICSAGDPLVKFFNAGKDLEIKYKEPLAPIGKMILTNFSINWKNQTNYQALGCSEKISCFELWICGGHRFVKFPERNVCDRIKFEDKWNPNTKELVLDFGEPWIMANWQLDISGNTLVEEKFARNLLFETSASYENKHADSGSFRYNAEDDHVKVSADVQIVCNADREGPNCVEKCDASGANHGSTWFCNEFGKKQCVSGWRGKDCKYYFCQNSCGHGDCIGPNQCSCHSGYLGSHCNLSNFCTENPNPCQFDGVCLGSSVDPTEYVCDCPNGSIGENCEVEVACLDGSCPVFVEEKKTEELLLTPMVLAIIVIVLVVVVLIAVLVFVAKYIVGNKRNRAMNVDESNGSSSSELDRLQETGNALVVKIEDCVKDPLSETH